MVVFLPTPSLGCDKGDAHTQATVMSPNHEREIELSEFMNDSAGYHVDTDVDRYPMNGFDNHYDANSAYDLPPYYCNSQVVPAAQIDCTKITALNKPLMGASMDNSWRGRHPNTWTHEQVVEWMYDVCKAQNIDYEHVRHSLGDMTGSTLVRLRKDEFDHRFSFVGSLIFDALEMELRGYSDANSMYQYSPQIEQPSYWSEMDLNGGNINNNNNNINGGADSISVMTGEGGGPGITNSRLEAVIHEQIGGNHAYGNYLLPGNHHGTAGGGEQIKCEVDSDVDSNQSSNQSFIYRSNIYTQNITLPHDNTKLQRRKPGRPPSKDKKSKNKNGQRNSRLWEFIRDLLLNPETCPSLLKWENVDEGIFRFVQSDKVARLWGQRKCNPRMTYEKLSRAMRTYYACHILEPVPKTGKYPKKLVYKFGPASFGWKEHKHYTQMSDFQEVCL